MSPDWVWLQNKRCCSASCSPEEGALASAGAGLAPWGYVRVLMRAPIQAKEGMARLHLVALVSGDGDAIPPTQCSSAPCSVSVLLFHRAAAVLLGSYPGAVAAQHQRCCRGLTQTDCFDSSASSPMRWLAGSVRFKQSYREKPAALPSLAPHSRGVGS